MDNLNNDGNFSERLRPGGEEEIKQEAQENLRRSVDRPSAQDFPKKDQETPMSIEEERVEERKDEVSAYGETALRKWQAGEYNGAREYYQLGINKIANFLRIYHMTGNIKDFFINKRELYLKAIQDINKEENPSENPEG